MLFRRNGGDSDMEKAREDINYLIKQKHDLIRAFEHKEIDEEYFRNKLEYLEKTINELMRFYENGQLRKAKEEV